MSQPSSHTSNTCDRICKEELTRRRRIPQFQRQIHPAEFSPSKSISQKVKMHGMDQRVYEAEEIFSMDL